jgi:Tol biopolymer transport system component
MRCRSLALTLAAVAASMAPCAATAACVPNPQAQSPNTFPSSLTGKLAYHSFVSYGDGTSQLFMYDFAARRLTQVSNPSWGIRDPMNAMFSPDGNWLAFMGVKDNAWNVFLWRVGTATLPVNLTNSVAQSRNEDPKFAADGKSLFFKRNGDVMQGTLGFTSAGPVFTSVVNLTQRAPAVESSMPFPSRDGTAVYYATGTRASLGLYRQLIGTTVNVAFDAPPGLAAYYPVVRRDGTVFYSRWRDATSQADQIYSKVNPGDVPRQLGFNDCNSSNSDPWPVDGTDYVFFSSTTAGGYQLYLGNAGTGQRWSLSPFGVNADSTKAKLGATYHPGASGPGRVVTLLSQGRPAWASSSYSPSLGPAYAFDGNTTTTRWDSIEGDAAGTQWLMVDLGAIRVITGVDLYWDAGAKVYAIQASLDARVWFNLYSTSSGVSWGHVSLPNLTGRGRYVRMYGTQRATPWGYSLNEMQVWGY